MSINKNNDALTEILNTINDLPISKEEQTKSIDITENGTTVVTPDEGMTLGEVTVNVAIESDGDESKDLKAFFLNTLTEINITEEFSLSSKRLSCTSLLRFSAPNLTGEISGYAFQNCGEVQYLDFGKVTKMAILGISGRHSIETIIFRNTDTVVSLNGTFTNNNSITNDSYKVQCYFYVPKALMEDYKVATNWSNYAHRFRALEDYPEITGGVI